MIGPHEGKELALMLSGAKNLALFHDALPLEGEEILEAIIPEHAFAPYIKEGAILRFAKDIRHIQKGSLIRYVLFTLPAEAWRAEFVLWLKQERLSGRIDHSPAHDILIGRLLGYREQDIQEFLEK